MGALKNAVELMGDFTFRQYCQAAAVYQSTVVAQEASTVTNHANRIKLAKKVLDNPEYLTTRLVSVLSTNPDIAKLGVTIGDGNDIPESLILSTVANVWDAMSALDA